VIAAIGEIVSKSKQGKYQLKSRELVRGLTPKLTRGLSIVQAGSSRFGVLMKRYFFENPGAPFLVAFQILFVWATFGLLLDAWIPSEVVPYAFYALVIGVSIQISVIARQSRKRNRTEDDSGAQT
jgi:hypothetical protein